MNFPHDLWAPRRIRPVVPLGELRDIVMAITEQRSPIWRFVIAPDLVMSIQAMSSSKRHRFEVRAVMAEGAAERRLLTAKKIEGPCLELVLVIVATSDVDWIIVFHSVQYSGQSRLEDFITLRDRVYRTFDVGQFDRLRAQDLIGHHCLICGKDLTDRVSQALLIGPECRHRYGAVMQWLAAQDAVPGGAGVYGRRLRCPVEFWDRGVRRIELMPSASALSRLADVLR